MAHRYRLVPTPSREAAFGMHCGHARYVWNLALEQANCLRPGHPRPLPEAAGMARVTLDPAGRWHASFAAPQPAVCRQTTGSCVGIDRGVATTVATSDGAMVRVPTMPKLARGIQRLQATLAEGFGPPEGDQARDRPGPRTHWTAEGTGWRKSAHDSSCPTT